MASSKRYTRGQFLSTAGRGLLASLVGGVATGASAAKPNEIPIAGPAEPPLPLALVKLNEFDPGIPQPVGLAASASNQLLIAGETGIRILDEQQKLIREIKTSGPACAVALDPEGNIYAAQRTRIEKFDAGGKMLHAWGEKGDDPGQLRYLTGLAANGRFVYVADAGARRIVRYAGDGDYIDEIDEFQIPSAFFDCLCDSQGLLYVGHTGKHRVERYDEGNQLVASWGRFGERREDFCGCCNPTNIALLSDGRIATTEKGVPRLKVYSPQGELLAMLGAGEFPGNAAGMDLAADGRDRIYLMEPVSKKVRIYEVKRL